MADAPEIDDHAVAYDFVQLGEGIADSMTKASEELVQRAQAILDQTVSMADIIRTQVKAQAEQIGEMNVRFRAFGEQMLDAHRKLNGEAPRLIDHAADATAHTARPDDVAKLRALDLDLSRRGRAEKHGTDAIANLEREREHIRKQRSQGTDGQRELPRPVATGEPHAPWVGHGKDRGGSATDPGTGTSGNGER